MSKLTRSRKTPIVSDNTESLVRQQEQQDSSPLESSSARQETDRSPTPSSVRHSEEETEEGSREDQYKKLRRDVQRVETAIREVLMSNNRQAESSRIESMGMRNSRPPSPSRSQGSQVSSHA